jgi:deoxyribonuclease-1
MRLILALLALSLSVYTDMPQAVAQQSAIPDYETARSVFWRQLYADGGETLYCGVPFGQERQRGLNVEHVFPMSWVTKELDCGTRRECRRYSKQFNHIEADLHNLFPSRTDVNDDRGSFPFGMVKGEARRYGQCDFEVHFKQRKVEPRPAVRGDIARAMFYMADSYGFKIFKRQGQMLARWHQEDPPDAADRRRNDTIERLQGNRNLFIDQPNRKLPF